MDGDADARAFLRVLVAYGRGMRYRWQGAQVLDNLRQDFGLNPGNVLHEWLRRLLDDATKQVLFAEGAWAAAGFVERFDWAGYREIRRQLLPAYQATDAVRPSSLSTIR